MQKYDLRLTVKVFFKTVTRPNGVRFLRFQCLIFLYYETISKIHIKDVLQIFIKFLPSNLKIYIYFAICHDNNASIESIKVLKNVLKIIFNLIWKKR